MKGKILYLPFILALMFCNVLLIGMPETSLNPLWSRFIDGLIVTVDWSKNNLLAVATTANKIFVFDSKGKLIWVHKIDFLYEKFREVWMKWNSKEFLGVLGDCEILVFDRNGELKWRLQWFYKKILEKRSDSLKAIGSGTITGVDWSSDCLLAVVVNRNWYYSEKTIQNTTIEVYDSDGHLLWIKVLNVTDKYYEIYDVKWIQDLLAVGTDEGIKVFDRNGKLMWSKKFNNVWDIMLESSPNGFLVACVEINKDSSLITLSLIHI